MVTVNLFDFKVVKICINEASSLVQNELFYITILNSYIIKFLSEEESDLYRA